MDLTLGPVLFDWGRDKLLEFYKEAAGWPVSDIYLGEVVCHRKRGLTPDDIIKIGEDLEKVGKNVVISTLSLVSDDKDLDVVREACLLPFAIEANDASALQLTKRKKGLVAGPHITSYNYDSVQFLKGIGVNRVVFPLELSRDAMAAITERSDIETEAFVYGKLPLAFSWRCYTSRAFGLMKSNCKIDCRKYPEGMMIETLERKPLFIVNGTQIMSALTMNLIDYLDELRDIGITKARISPQYGVTGDVVKVFKERLDGRISVGEANNRLKALEKTGFCNGWYHGKAGWEDVKESAEWKSLVIE
ncbi:MAG: U32 family peptidase [Deltaproteobacteria bacterium]